MEFWSDGEPGFLTRYSTTPPLQYSKLLFYGRKLKSINCCGV